MNETIQKALESFCAEFPNAIYADLKIGGLTQNWMASDDIQAFLEKTLASAITKAFEEVKVGEVEVPQSDYRATYYQGYDAGKNAALTEVEEKKTNFLKQ